MVLRMVRRAVECGVRHSRFIRVALVDDIVVAASVAPKLARAPVLCTRAAPRRVAQPAKDHEHTCVRRLPKLA